MLDNTLIIHSTTLLHNIWHHSFLIFETTCFQHWKGPCLTLDSTLVQRLTTPLSNVWQYFYLTLDNTFVKRWIIILSAVWKCLIIIFIYFAQISTMIIWKTMYGRSVVENTGSKQSTTATNHYLTIHYTIPVVVWSNFLENKNLMDSKYGNRIIYSRR